MQVLTEAQKGFLRLDYEFIDLGLLAAIDPAVFALYLTIRRFIWRTNKSGSAWCRDAYAEGKLATFINQKTLAKITGVSLATLKRRMAALRDTGWLETEETEAGGTLLYILGEWLPGPLDSKAEVFYADLFCNKLLHAMEAEARRHRKASFRDIPYEERLSFTKRCLEDYEVLNEEGWLKPEPGVGLNSEPGGQLTDEPGGSSDLSYKRIDNDIEERRGERENDIEQRGGGSASLHPSPDPERWGHLKKAPPPELLGGGEESESSRLNSVNTTERKKSKKAFIAELKAKAKARTTKEVTKKLQKAARREQKAENLKGKPTGRVYKELEALWQAEMKKHHPQARVPKWAGKEIGQFKRLLESYTLEDVKATIQYTVASWSAIKEQKKWLKGGAPSVAVVARFHEQLVNEAVAWSRVAPVAAEWNAWWEEHPYEDAPEDLKKRYREIETQAVALGLVA